MPSQKALTPPLPQRHCPPPHPKRCSPPSLGCVLRVPFWYPQCQGGCDAVADLSPSQRCGPYTAPPPPHCHNNSTGGDGDSPQHSVGAFTVDGVGGVKGGLGGVTPLGGGWMCLVVFFLLRRRYKMHNSLWVGGPPPPAGAGYPRTLS